MHDFLEIRSSSLKLARLFFFTVGSVMGLGILILILRSEWDSKILVSLAFCVAFLFVAAVAATYDGGLRFYRNPNRVTHFRRYLFRNQSTDFILPEGGTILISWDKTADWEGDYVVTFENIDVGELYRTSAVGDDALKTANQIAKFLGYQVRDLRNN